MTEKLTEADRAQIRADAFVNLATGMGGCEDKGQATVVIGKRFKNRGELEETYKDNALAGRIVDRPAKDATREGFTITGTDEGVDFAVVSSDMEDLGFHTALTQALQWARLHGGSLLIPLVDDGQPMDKPLNIDAVKKFEGFRVVDRWRAMVSPESFTTGAGVDFTNPEFYQLSTSQRLPDGSLLDGKIHRSRVMRFDGVALPFDLLARNGYWGMSVLEAGWRDIARLDTVRQYMEDGAHSVTGMVLKIRGLTKALKGAANDSKGASVAEKIRLGLQRLRNNWDNLHWLALDTEDDIAQGNRSVQGLRDLEKIFVDALVMDYDIPRELIVHELKGALTTGESAGSIRLYYDAISAGQRMDLTPVVNRTLELYFAAKGQTIDQWTVKWNPLWQLTDKEKAEIRKLDMETLTGYWTMGVLETSEIREKVFIENEDALIEIEAPEFEETEEDVVVEAPELPEGVEGAAVEEAVTPEAADPGDAFNGAQVQALAGIVLQVANGDIPFESGVQLIAISFPVSEVEAVRLLDPVRESGAKAAEVKANPPPMPAAMVAEQSKPPPGPGVEVGEDTGDEDGEAEA